MTTRSDATLRAGTCGALCALSLMASGIAQAFPGRIDPCTGVDPFLNAAVAITPVAGSGECKPVSLSQPGVTNSTLSGSASTLGTAVGDVVGGALGGGVSTAAGLVNRTALGGRTGQAAAAGALRWNLWAAYSNVDVGYSFQPLQSGGHANLFLGGVDYTFGDSLVAGVAVTDERTRIDTTYNSGKISGNGNTVAPYLGWRINRNWLLDASVGFGDTRLSSTDNSVPGGITGSNKVSRTSATLGIAYNQAMGRWLLTGKGSLLTLENRFSEFTQSNNVVVSGTTVRTSQVRLGGQAAYNAGNLVPFVGLTYIYDIEHAGQGAVGGQNAANDRDGWQVRAGLNIRSSGALYGGIVLSSEVGRSQVKNDQIMVNIGLRF